MRIGAMVAVLVLSVVPRHLLAQRTAERAASPPAGETAHHDVRECWRFVFGPWQPVLDWRGAGHAGRAPADYPGAGGRGAPAPTSAPGSAAWTAAAGDTALILFPDWWPAGVTVRLEPAASAMADTVKGTATALVADGRLRNPVSRIIAIRRPCGGSGGQ